MRRVCLRGELGRESDHRLGLARAACILRPHRPDRAHDGSPDDQHRPSVSRVICQRRCASVIVSGARRRRLRDLFGARHSVYGMPARQSLPLVGSSYRRFKPNPCSIATAQHLWSLWELFRTNRRSRCGGAGDRFVHRAGLISPYAAIWVIRAGCCPALSTVRRRGGTEGIG